MSGTEIDRRQAMLLGAGAVGLGLATAIPEASASAAWRAGALRHVIPTASADAILLKCSFDRPLAGKVVAMIGGHAVPGHQTDSAGRFWTFWAKGLAPGMPQRIALTANGKLLSDPWSVRTLPASGADPARFRMLTFMCAGGDESARGPKGIESFRPIATRRRLLARGLSFAPDVVVANGDHIYWDQKSWLMNRNADIREATKHAYDQWGYLDPRLPVLGTANENLVQRVGDEQIARLYGTMLRETPSYFIPDDHDYIENDEAEERFVTFPADELQREVQRVMQRLYYPEFLPQDHLPQGLAGTSHEGWSRGLSRSFGTIRYGKLVEALLYDTIGFMSLKDRNAGLIPPEAEAWLLDRILASDAHQMLHLPSFPLGWTAGKWREWYPDVVAAAVNAQGETEVHTHGFGGVGRLTTDRPKYLWQQGWFAQHQRLVAAMAATTRPAIVVSGDIHAVGKTKIVASGDLDLSANPIHAFLVGSIGASKSGFPSFARGTPPSTPAALKAEGFEFPKEENGFSIVDVEPDSVTVRQFRWTDSVPLAAIDTLEPFDTTVIARRG